MEVRLSRKAHKILKTLDPSIRSGIVERLLELEENPYPSDRIKVHGMEGVYRIRSETIGYCMRSEGRRG